MKAMIFAAGLGTRLKPLTDYRPKALVKVKGMPLLEIVIQRLKLFGVKDIIINVHHFAPMMIEFLTKNNNFNINIAISDESKCLLNTGGGLKKAAGFFDDDQPFLLVNTDILTNLDLKELYEAHLQSDAIATLAVRHRETSRYLLFDEGMAMHGWANVKSGEIKLSRNDSEQLQMLAFSGIHVIDPKIFQFMPIDDVFSIIDIYLKVAKTERIKGYLHNENMWLDVGKIESLEKAEALVDHLMI